MTADICKGINMPAELIPEIIKRSQQIDFAEINDSIQMLFNKETWTQALEGMRRYLGNDTNGIGMLACLLHAADITLDRYKTAGISEEIFYATFGCFSRFVCEYKDSFGVYGFDREWWVPREISMEEFRIGELEYEKREHNGRKLLSIHIPSDAKMTAENCAKSISAAKAFMKCYIPEYKYEGFYCNSWLLAPNLKHVLKENSNIIKFQSAFEIEEQNLEDMEFITWVFKVPCKEYEITDDQRTISAALTDKLPEQTSLQRNLKEYMRNGGLIGSAAGILRDETFGN